jgi:CheY-like chemotaxis protein
VHILCATDAQWVLDEVVAAFGSSSTSFTVVTEGRDVAATGNSPTPDQVVLDMQIGSMGAMAVTMDLRLDHTGGRLPRVPIMLLLDRAAEDEEPVDVEEHCTSEGNTDIGEPSTIEVRETTFS